VNAPCPHARPRHAPALRRAFSLLEAIVGVAIATAFLGAIALFTTNLGDSRARLARTSREIDCAVRTIVDSAFHKAAGIVDRERAQLDRGAQLLLQKETLGEEDLRAFRSAQPAVTA
jgi:ATP-dependent Zn protease